MESANRRFRSSLMKHKNKVKQSPTRAGFNLRSIIFYLFISLIMLLLMHILFYSKAFNYRQFISIQHNASTTIQDSIKNSDLHNNIQSNDRYSTTKSLIEKLVNLIYLRYELHNEEFLDFHLAIWNIPFHGWDILKYKLAQRILQPNSSFYMLFSGSAVTAGYDNYYSQSYPEVFKKRMKPIFDSLGVNLVVHNIGQEQISCHLSTLCIESHGLPKMDFLSWEHSFECGRSIDVFEFVARIAGWNKAVIHFSSSGSIPIKSCLPSKEAVPWISEEWRPETAKIPFEDHVYITNDTVIEFRDVLNDWFSSGSSVSKFINRLGDPYQGVGAHGFNFWAVNKKLCEKKKHDKSEVMNLNQSSVEDNVAKLKDKDDCSAPSTKAAQCHENGGPKWHTSEFYNFGNLNLTAKNRWHPTAGMHRMRAEVMVFAYSLVLVDAIQMIERDFKQSTREEMIQQFERELEILQKPIPDEPFHCRSLDCRDRPKCFTDFEPHFNFEQQISSIVVKKQEGWSRHSIDFRPSQQIFGHVDQKVYFRGKGHSREIFLLFESGPLGILRLYGRAHSESLMDAVFVLDPNITLPPNRSCSALDHTYLNQTSTHKDDNGKSGVYSSWLQTDFKYKPSGRRFELKDKNYSIGVESSVGGGAKGLVVGLGMGGGSREVVQLAGVPPRGCHVLSVITDPYRPDHATFISHFVVL